MRFLGGMGRRQRLGRMSCEARRGGIWVLKKKKKIKVVWGMKDENCMKRLKIAKSDQVKLFRCEPLEKNK